MEPRRRGRPLVAASRVGRIDSPAAPPTGGRGCDAAARAPGSAPADVPWNPPRDTRTDDASRGRRWIGLVADAAAATIRSSWSRSDVAYATGSSPPRHGVPSGGKDTRARQPVRCTQIRMRGIRIVARRLGDGCADRWSEPDADCQASDPRHGSRPSPTDASSAPRRRRASHAAREIPGVDDPLRADGGLARGVARQSPAEGPQRPPAVGAVALAGGAPRGRLLTAAPGAARGAAGRRGRHGPAAASPGSRGRQRGAPARRSRGAGGVSSRAQRGGV